MTTPQLKRLTIPGHTVKNVVHADGITTVTVLGSLSKSGAAFVADQAMAQLAPSSYRIDTAPAVAPSLGR